MESDPEQLRKQKNICALMEAFGRAFEMRQKKKVDHPSNSRTFPEDEGRTRRRDASTQTDEEPHRGILQRFTVTCHLCAARFRNYLSLHEHMPVHRSAGPTLPVRSSMEINFNIKACFVKLNRCSDTREKQSTCLLQKQCSTVSTQATFLPAQTSERVLEKEFLSHNTSTQTGRNLSSRENNVQPAKKLFLCALCPKSFRKETFLQKHKSMHEGRESFLSGKISSHITQQSHSPKHDVCTDEKAFPCSQCAKSFEKETFLQKHMSVHSDETPFSCSLCPAQFKRQSNLRSHMHVHSEKKLFSCAHCSRAFKQKQGMQRHIMFVHVGEKTFSCKVCSARFKLGHHLRRHMHVHSEEKLFTCDHCSKAFKIKDKLLKHMVTHRDEKPHVCAHCPARFKRANNLRAHELTHTDKKPFSCSLCSKKFKQKELVKRHMVVHVQMKSYVCCQCSKKFKREDNLRDHERRVHSVKKANNTAKCKKYPIMRPKVSNKSGNV